MPQFHYNYSRSSSSVSPVVAGRYQLAGGAWQDGLLYPDAPERLKIIAKDHDTLVYQTNQIAAFAINTDTFKVVRGLAAGSGRLDAVFAQHLYRYGQISAFKVPHRLVRDGKIRAQDGYTSVFDLVLQSGTADAVVIPVSRRAFIEAMLPLVGTCPELATQITKGKLWRENMRYILKTYARWQQANAPTVTN